MTEELKQKAEEYAIENYEQCIYDDVRGWENDFRARKESYIAGAIIATKEFEKERLQIIGNCSDREEGLRRKIADLEKQIEKMKCCFNCKHSRTEYEHCRTDKHEKWELAE